MSESPDHSVDAIAPAGLPERGVAWAIDFMFLLLLIGFVNFLPLPPEWNAGLALFIALAYSTMEFIGAGTMGKIVLDLQIATRDGTPADRPRRVARWCLRNPAVLLLTLSFAGWHVVRHANVGTTAAKMWDFLGIAICALQAAAILGCLMALLPGRRSLQDRLTGTAVFRADKIRAAATGHGFAPVIRAGSS